MERSDTEALNTALALSAAALQLQADMLYRLVDNKVISASDALSIVRESRRKLEGQGQPGGVRASIYLEPLEEKLQRHVDG